MSFHKKSLNGAPVYISDRCNIFTPHFTDENFFIDLQKNVKSFVKAAIQPDYHRGTNSLPVGTAVMTYDSISYDAVGNDINCGVRAIDLKITKEEFLRKKDLLISILKNIIDVGLYDSTSEYRVYGYAHKNVNYAYSPKEYEYDFTDILNFGCKNIPTSIDSNSYFEYDGSVMGNSKFISQKAKWKGKNSLGTVGSGNHYIEFSVRENNQMIAMIHTGSRGLGYQICSDYTRQHEHEQSIDAFKLCNNNFKEYFYEKNSALFFSNKITNFYENYNRTEINCTTDSNIKMPTFLPLSSKIGQSYFYAMNSAKNYAYVNRTILGNKIADLFKNIFKVDCTLITDCSHNSASAEYTPDYNLNYRENKRNELSGNNFIIHRKGATRVLPPSLFPSFSSFSNTGHPYIIGGSMCTASYIMHSTELAGEQLLSSAHGSGRLVPRNIANKNFTGDEIISFLESRNITLLSRTEKELRQENHKCYRDVDEVIKYIDQLNRSIIKYEKVYPLIVFKG